MSDNADAIYLALNQIIFCSLVNQVFVKQILVLLAATQEIFSNFERKLFYFLFFIWLDVPYLTYKHSVQDCIVS